MNTKRRQNFLGVHCGALIVLAAALVLPGCGGGNGGGVGGGSVTTRDAAIRDSLAAFAAIPASTPDAENQAMLDWFHGNAEFVDSGISGGNVWAHCKDHTTVIMVNNRRAVDDGARAATVPASRLAIDMPTSKSARVINNFSGGNAAATNKIVSILQKAGYTVSSGTASVSQLGNLGGDGVFYIDSHGLSLMEDDGKDTYYLMASDVYDEKNTTSHNAGLNSHFLSVLGEKTSVRQADGSFKVVTSGHYAVSDRYASSNWGPTAFGQNSFLFINACSSSKTPLFRGVCFAKGGSTYAGWTGDVLNDFALKVAPFVFDRLSGADTVDKEADGPQRPFDYTTLPGDLSKHGLTADSRGASLTVTQKPGTDFGLLTPTIAYMGVDEFKKELTITGIFGTVQGKVTVDGTEVAINGWGFNTIRCDLPEGLAGDTIVEVRGHKSNVVRLTEWVGTFKTLFESGLGTLKVVGFLEVHFRADIHSHRDLPHDKPFDPIVPFQGEQTSRGQFTASGVYTSPCGDGGIETTTWKGTVALQPIQFNNPKNLLTCFGSIDVKQKKIDIELMGASVDGLTELAVGCGGTTTDLVAAVTGHLDAGDGENPVLHLGLNDDFSINGGIRDENVGPLHFRTEWDKITPRFPPDKLAARSAVAARSKR